MVLVREQRERQPVLVRDFRSFAGGPAARPLNGVRVLVISCPVRDRRTPASYAPCPPSVKVEDDFCPRSSRDERLAVLVRMRNPVLFLLAPCRSHYLRGFRTGKAPCGVARSDRHLPSDRRARPRAHGRRRRRRHPQPAVRDGCGRRRSRPRRPRRPRRRRASRRAGGPRNRDRSRSLRRPRRGRFDRARGPRRDRPRRRHPGSPRNARLRRTRRVGTRPARRRARAGRLDRRARACRGSVRRGRPLVGRPRAQGRRLHPPGADARGPSLN